MAFSEVDLPSGKAGEEGGQETRVSRRETCPGMASTPASRSLAAQGSLWEHSAEVYRIAGNWVQGFGVCGGGLEQFIFQRYKKGGLNLILVQLCSLIKVIHHPLFTSVRTKLYCPPKLLRTCMRCPEAGAAEVQGKEQARTLFLRVL